MTRQLEKGPEVIFKEFNFERLWSDVCSRGLTIGFNHLGDVTLPVNFCRVVKLIICWARTRSAARWRCRGRRYVPLHAGGAAGRCVSAAAAAAEAGPPVPAPGLRWPAASGRPQEAGDRQAGGGCPSKRTTITLFFFWPCIQQFRPSV